MTARVITTLPPRAIRDALLAGLAGVVAPHVGAAGCGLVASAVWGSALRVAGFLDLTASRPPRYVAASPAFAAVVGVLIAARWGLWVAFAAGVVLPAAHALWRPVALLFIASSALGLRLGARG